MTNDELLISTKDRPGTYDAIETAKPDEPLFGIQGGDPFGPATVLHWASLARAAGLAEIDPAKAGRLLKKASAAEQVAWAMRDYQLGHNEADSEPKPEPFIKLDADHAEASRLQILVHGATRLDNAVAEAVAIAESLAALDEFPKARMRIREASELLKKGAFEIEPRRNLRRES